MNFDQAFSLAVAHLRANIPFALWGHPGVGKSALGQLLADTYELQFIDIRLGQIDPVDLNGFVHKDEASGTFDYLPWARFPLENTPFPTNPKTGQPYKGWLMMFDEVNTAPRQNLAAAYKIFLDRMVGAQKLHPRCFLMMGGNLVGEGLAGALPSPLVSRAAHLYLEPELTPSVRQILGPSISAFLTNHPKFIYQESTEPNTPFPTLRTWDMLNRFRNANPQLPEDRLLEAFSSIVGTSAAVSYASFIMQERDLQKLIQGVEQFPLENSQDLLDYMASDVVLLEKHLHRFPGEWNAIAKVKVESLKAGTEDPQTSQASN